MKRTALIRETLGWFFIGSLGMACVACDQTPPKDESESSQASAPPKPAVATAPPVGAAPTAAPAQGEVTPPLAPDFPQTKLGDIPTSEDLEDEADNTVAFQNLEAELDRLEAEIVDSPN